MASSGIGSFVLYALGLMAMRGEDVILSSFPRSGSTWVRFLLANLISLLECNGQPIDFLQLNKTMPALGTNNLLRTWPHPTIPRVVKTHKPYWPSFSRNRSIGLIRDPRDVMVSFYHYRKDRKGKEVGTFAEFIRDPHVGLQSWVRHYTSWHSHWTLTVRYEDLKQDTFREFKRILTLLKVGYPEEVVSEGISRTTLQNTRNAETSSLASTKPEARFARSGQTGQWPAYFDKQDLVYCDKLMARHKIDVYVEQAPTLHKFVDAASLMSRDERGTL
jgi:sulfotransferase family protein